MKNLHVYYNLSCYVTENNIQVAVLQRPPSAQNVCNNLPEENKKPRMTTAALRQGMPLSCAVHITLHIDGISTLVKNLGFSRLTKNYKINSNQKNLSCGLPRPCKGYKYPYTCYYTRKPEVVNSCICKSLLL